MIETFFTVHYAMGFFLMTFAILIAFAFFAYVIGRMFDLLDKIVVGHYVSKVGNCPDLFEYSKDKEENDEN